MLSRTHDGTIVLQDVKSWKQFRYVDPDQRQDSEFVEGNEQETRFPGSLLPMIIIALSMWAVLITAGIWLFQHLHF